MIESILAEQNYEFNTAKLNREFESKRSDLDLILSLSQNIISHYSHIDLASLHGEPT